ncbi:hypothetical protein MaudCBS49596_003091 [Microsporum audouinii]
MNTNGTETKQTNGQNERLRCGDVFLFSHARTLSNVFCRLLSAQPGWVQSEYHFQEAFMFARSSFNWAPLTDITTEQREQFFDLFYQGMDALQKARDDAVAEGKHLLVKNHTFFVWEPSALSQIIWGGKKTSPLAVLPRQPVAEGVRTNGTIFSDEFLTSWKPVFLIRHPALVFESWYKAEIRVKPIDILDKTWSYMTTFRYSRQLYDWYMSSLCDDAKGEMGKPRPIVVDADDILSGECLAEVCRQCGMDVEHIMYEWEKTNPNERKVLTERHLSYMGDLWASTGLDRSKSSEGLDMQVKYGKWKEEFGIVVADELYRLVEDAMPDFEYLKSKRI